MSYILMDELSESYKKEYFCKTGKQAEQCDSSRHVFSTGTKQHQQRTETKRLLQNPLLPVHRPRQCSLLSPWLSKRSRESGHPHFQCFTA